NIARFASTSALSFQIREAFDRVRGDSDVLARDARLMENMYPFMVQFRNRKSVQIAEVTFAFPWATLRSWVYGGDLRDKRYLERLAKRLRVLGTRASRVGGRISMKSIHLRVPPLEMVSRKVGESKNELSRARLAEYHLREMQRLYLKNHDEGVFHANLAYRYNPRPDPNSSNNLGYVFLAGNELASAKQLLERANEGSSEASLRALSNYNLGIVYARLGNLTQALALIDLCVQQFAGTPEADGKLLCLFLRKLTKGKLSFHEIEEPDLLETAKKAKAEILRLVEVPLAGALTK